MSILLQLKARILSNLKSERRWGRIERRAGNKVLFVDEALQKTFDDISQSIDIIDAEIKEYRSDTVAKAKIKKFHTINVEHLETTHKTLHIQTERLVQSVEALCKYRYQHMLDATKTLQDILNYILTNSRLVIDKYEAIIATTRHSAEILRDRTPAEAKQAKELTALKDEYVRLKENLQKLCATCDTLNGKLASAIARTTSQRGEYESSFAGLRSISADVKNEDIAAIGQMEQREMKASQTSLQEMLYITDEIKKIEKNIKPHLTERTNDSESKSSPERIDPVLANRNPEMLFEQALRLVPLLQQLADNIEQSNKEEFRILADCIQSIKTEQRTINDIIARVEMLPDLKGNPHPRMELQWQIDDLKRVANDDAQIGKEARDIMRGTTVSIDKIEGQLGTSITELAITLKKLKEAANNTIQENRKIAIDPAPAQIPSESTVMIKEGKCSTNYGDNIDVWLISGIPFEGKHYQICLPKKLLRFTNRARSSVYYVTQHMHKVVNKYGTDVGPDRDSSRPVIWKDIDDYQKKNGRYPESFGELTTFIQDGTHNVITPSAKFFFALLKFLISDEVNKNQVCGAMAKDILDFLGSKRFLLFTNIDKVKIIKSNTDEGPGTYYANVISFSPLYPHSEGSNCHVEIREGSTLSYMMDEHPGLRQNLRLHDLPSELINEMLGVQKYDDVNDVISKAFSHSQNNALGLISNDGSTSMMFSNGQFACSLFEPDVLIMGNSKVFREKPIQERE